MVDTFDSKAFVLEAAELLEDQKGHDTVAIDVRGISSITDYLVITTVTSNMQMRGLLERLSEHCDRYNVAPLNSHKSPDDTGWVLLDCEFVIFHLMTRDMREFYELERLWFAGETVYGAIEERAE